MDIASPQKFNFKIPCITQQTGYIDVQLEVCACGSSFGEDTYPIGDVYSQQIASKSTNANIEPRSIKNILDYNIDQLQFSNEKVSQEIQQSVPMRRANSYDSRQIKNLNEEITCLHKEHKDLKSYDTKKKMRGVDLEPINAAQSLILPGTVEPDIASARASVDTGEVATKAKTGCGYDQRLEYLIAALFNIYRETASRIEETPNIDTMPWLIYIVTDDVYSRYNDVYINQQIFHEFGGRNFNDMIEYIRTEGYPQGEPILQYFHDTKFGQTMLPYMRRNYMDILIELTARPDLVIPFVLTSYQQPSGVSGDRWTQGIIVDHWANIVFKGYKCVGPFLHNGTQICVKMPIYGIRTAWGQGGTAGFYFLPTSNHFTFFELIELFCYLCTDSRGREEPASRLKELFNAAFFRPEAAKTHRGPYDTPENVCGRACKYSDKSMKDLTLSFLKVPISHLHTNQFTNIDGYGYANVMDLLQDLLKQEFVVKDLTVAVVKDLTVATKRSRDERGGKTKRRRQTNKKQRMKKYDKKRKTSKRRCKKSRRI